MITVHRNAVVGETVTMHAATDGVLRLEIDVEPVHHAPAVHVHPRAAETFTVVDGELRVRTGLRRRTLRAGDAVPVAPGVMHAYAGVPGWSARVRVELEPPGRMAEFSPRSTACSPPAAIPGPVA
jgi:quercetin dioxygenase-like cupin family protein